MSAYIDFTKNGIDLLTEKLILYLSGVKRMHYLRFDLLPSIDYLKVPIPAGEEHNFLL